MSLISGANPSPRSCSSPSPILSGTRRLSPANSIRFSPPMQLHEHDNPRRLHFLQGLLSSYPIWLPQAAHIRLEWIWQLKYHSYQVQSSSLTPNQSRAFWNKAGNTSKQPWIPIISTTSWTWKSDGLHFLQSLPSAFPESFQLQEAHEGWKTPGQTAGAEIQGPLRRSKAGRWSQNLPRKVADAVR